jgi:chitodextrinase
VPESFLNPGATYYWKVRARDSQGNISRWSQVFRFTTAG